MAGYSFWRVSLKLSAIDVQKAPTNFTTYVAYVVDGQPVGTGFGSHLRHAEHRAVNEFLDDLGLPRLPSFKYGTEGGRSAPRSFADIEQLRQWDSE